MEGHRAQRMEKDQRLSGDFLLLLFMLRPSESPRFPSMEGNLRETPPQIPSSQKSHAGQSPTR